MGAPDDALDLDPIKPAEDVPRRKKLGSAKPRNDEDGDEGGKVRRGPRARDERDEEDRDSDTRERARKEDRAKKKKPRRTDTDDDEPRRPPPKLGDRKVPYPPPPAIVPDDLTEYPQSYIRQETRLLINLFLFLTFYIGALLFCLLIGTWCVWSIWHWFPFKVFGIACTGGFFLFLIKGFFKSTPIDRDTTIVITEDEHPVLFEFIYRLCEEVGAPLPNKVLLSPDVNASCIAHSSIFSLFKEPKKDLLIGLGLVNSVNLSEFKAILAHEFGHFRHVGHSHNYTYIAQSVILDMIRGEDWFDRTIEHLKRSESFRGLGLALGGPLWLWREMLSKVFNLIALQNQAVAREQEFHADLVAVSAAGSDAATHMLLRLRFGVACFFQALEDLMTARDHKMYSSDLFLHQSRAAAVVRRKKQDPHLGLPPAIGPEGGKRVHVFDAEQDAIEDENLTPLMWRSHPAAADREENAKHDYVAAPLDHRSPWILFDDLADLKERMTYKFYRNHRAFRISKNADLTDAKSVQTFIDNEHSETTYSPKYKGIYDDRPIQPVAPEKDGRPGDLGELDRLVAEKPWTDDRIERVLEKLYDGCRDKAEDLDDLRKERALLDNTPGRKSNRLKKKIAAIDKKLDDLWEWLRSLDRRVYMIHVQMAGAVNREWKEELIERYRFQLEVQRLWSQARYHQQRALAFARLLFNLPPGQANPELFTEVMSVLREAWRALKKLVQSAREINLPAMKNFEEGDRLADFILEGKMVPEPPLSYVKGTWAQKLVDQLGAVRARCTRLHYKSLGGILELQEKIAERWNTLREPVAAVVIAELPVAAEIHEAVLAHALPGEMLPDSTVVPAPSGKIEPQQVALIPPVSVAALAEPEPQPEASPQPAILAAPPFLTPPVPMKPHPVIGWDAHPPAATPPSHPVAARDDEPGFEEHTTTGAEEEMCSLGADDATLLEPMPEIQSRAYHRATASQDAAAAFSLDPDHAGAVSEPIRPQETLPAISEPPPVAASEPAPVATPSARTPSEEPAVALSGTTKVAAQRTVAGSSAIPGRGKRPPLKITIVLPGERSPLSGV